MPLYNYHARKLTHDSSVGKMAFSRLLSYCESYVGTKEKCGQAQQRKCEIIFKNAVLILSANFILLFEIEAIFYISMDGYWFIFHLLKS